MFLTIAIPTYNNESTIAKAIESCINQPEIPGEYEVLIINNASKDNTASIIDKYRDHPTVRIVTNSETCTLFENHNVAFKNALGDYVIFCHSDDVLQVETSRIVYELLKRYNFPKRFIFWGYSFYRDFTYNVERSGKKIGVPFGGINATKVFLRGGLTPSGTCYSKAFGQEIGFLKTNFKLTPSDLTSMLLAVLRGFEFLMIPRLLFKRTAASTLKSNVNEKDVAIAIEDAFQQLKLKLSKQEMRLIYNAAIEDSKNVSSIALLGLKADFKKDLKKKLLFKSIKNPMSLKNKQYRFLLRKVYF